MMKRTVNRYSHGAHAGFVLVSVLWILALLTVISLGFARRAMLERRMAWYALDREQAQQMARAAVERGLFEIRHKALLNGFDNLQGYTGLDQRWARPIDLLAEGRYFEDLDPEAFQADVCEVVIEDTETRIALNDAPRRLLEAVEGLQFRTIDRLMEARDVSTPGYLEPLIYSVEDLRQMQRISDAEWEGTEAKPGIADLVTANKTSGRINVNTAPERVLAQLPDVEATLLRQIMEYRNGPDERPFTADDRAFKNFDDMSRRLKISADALSPIRRFCTTDSNYFTIHGRASRRRGKIIAHCTVTIELQGTSPRILSWKEGTLGA